MEYKQAWEMQLYYAEQLLEGGPETLIFVEHEPVYTLGANFHAENMAMPLEFYTDKGISIERTDRGGDVTYHGPGQLTIYPIFSIEKRGKDLHKWLRDLEEVVLTVLRNEGFEGYRFPPHTGAWIDGKKVAAIGIKAKRWINIHGIGFNINNDLEPFRWIIPCGIKEYGVTNLQQILGREVSLEEAKSLVCKAFEEVFELTKLGHSNETKA